MAAPKRFNNKDKRPKRNTQSLLFKRKKFCRFTVAKVEQVDYKDVDTLKDFIQENGKIMPARVMLTDLTLASISSTSSPLPKIRIFGTSKPNRPRFASFTAALSVRMMSSFFAASSSAATFSS